ncbi:MAG: aminopeptidase [Gemmatimonadales bacterium]|nr:aminopeptidase [Candidatus Palauibacter irciniicola]MYC18878.1 aminopeptidase [Gemmatimonadales bacterium]
MRVSAARPGRARLPVSRGRAALLLLLLCAGGCSPAYVLRAGWEEARILSARRPIRAVIHDTTVARETRDKLRLVLDARDFAERDLGLRAGASYESFTQLHRDTLVLIVLAAPEFDLRWKTWWFPIVGHVPYKGFFDFDDARAEAAGLAEEGYDVSVRPVSAFSTLGWFPDPIMSTTLRLDSLGLVETVIHEITHSTYFPTGQADFNESFANFVGYRGAIEFFCEAVADESACVRAQWRWEDTRVFGHFFHSILAPLEEVYASAMPDDAKRAAKREVFEAAAQRFETEYKPRLHAQYGSLDPDGLDNAWMISRLLYYTRLDDFERVYESHGALVPSVEALMREAAAGDPWEALTRLVGPADTGPAETGPGKTDDSATTKGSR